MLSPVASVAPPAASIAAAALGSDAVKAVEVVEGWVALMPFSVASSTLLLPLVDVVLDVVVQGELTFVSQRQIQLSGLHSTSRRKNSAVLW